MAKPTENPKVEGFLDGMFREPIHVTSILATAVREDLAHNNVPEEQLAPYLVQRIADSIGALMEFWNDEEAWDMGKACIVYLRNSRRLSYGEIKGRVRNVLNARLDGER